MAAEQGAAARQPFFLTNPAGRPAGRPAHIRYPVLGIRYEVLELVTSIKLWSQRLESLMESQNAEIQGNPRQPVFLVVGLWGLGVKGLNNQEIFNNQPYVLICMFYRKFRI